MKCSRNLPASRVFVVKGITGPELLILRAGNTLEKSVGGSYLAFHDESLTWMDTNIPAPGNELAVFQELSKNLDVLLGPSDKMQTDKNGGRLKRVRIWMTTSGPPSGAGEVVKLTLIEGENWINLRIEDPKYQR